MHKSVRSLVSCVRPALAGSVLALSVLSASAAVLVPSGGNDAETFVLGVTLADDGSGSATSDTLVAETDERSLFILGIGPAL